MRYVPRWRTISTVSVRAPLAVIGWGCLGVVLVLRCVQLQVVQADLWGERAVENVLYSIQETQQRGAVLDRYGAVIAGNLPEYYQLSNPAALYPVARLVDATTALSLMATSSDQIVTRSHRWYPFGPVLAPLLGYVGKVTARELQLMPAVGIRDVVGKQGLELSWDAALRGAPGSTQFHISALGLKQRLVNQDQPVTGAPRSTSLDAVMSAVAYQALGDARGAVVVVDSQTGQVLAAVSKPAFDSNTLTTTSAQPQLEAARRASVAAQLVDPDHLFFNRAISGEYPPGSIFKLVTALSALDSGAFTAQTQINDEGTLKVGEFSFANWYFSQYGRTEGPLTLQRALARSNDIYFYQAAEAAGPEKIAEMAHRLGLGQRTGLGLAVESAGLIPTPAWKESVKNEKWFLGNTYHMGIGQGDVLTTPVQVAQLLQVLAQHGKKCPLTLSLQSTAECESLGMADEQVEVVLKGMLDACSAGGTGYPFFPWNTQRRSAEATSSHDDLTSGAVACKTGTAEFGAADGQGRRRTHGWFAAIIDPSALLEAQQTTLKSSPTRSPIAEWLTQVSSRSSQLSGMDKLRQYQLLLNTQELQPMEKSASESAVIDHDNWLGNVVQQEAVGKPWGPLAIVVLVESDDTHHFREGSRDAAPVALKIVNWMAGKD